MGRQNILRKIGGWMSRDIGVCELRLPTGAHELPCPKCRLKHTKEEYVTFFRIYGSVAYYPYFNSSDFGENRDSVRAFQSYGILLPSGTFFVRCCVFSPFFSPFR